MANAGAFRDHGLSPAFTVGQENQPAFKVHVLPLQIQDFAQPAAGEQQ
jgi:hypothetical protein